MNQPHARALPATAAAPARAMVLASLLWLALAMAMVVARGVRWDESYEHAQVIAGIVAYPEDHPHGVYAHNAFTAQTALSALLLKAGISPWGVEFTRNVLFLWATVLPPCLLGIALTRRGWPGHVAALLTLGGVFLVFNGSYPLTVWPETYSNGHIGGGWALAALAVLLAGHLRTGMLLFGMLPAVHVGQWPVLLGWVCCAAVWLAWRRDWPTLGRGAVWATAGFAITAGYALIHAWVLRVPAGDTLTVEARELWEAFTRFHDIHRRPPGVNGHIMIAGTLALSGLAMLRPPRPPMGPPIAGVALYAMGVAAAVWGTHLLTVLTGGNLPFAIHAWMPYRMVNHLPAYFAALAAALLLRRGAVPWPALALAGFAAVFALLPLALRAAGDGALARMLTAYVGEGEAVVFFLFGVAAMALLPGRWGARWGMLLACAAALALFHQFGAACVVLGAVAFAGGKRLPPWPWERPAFRIAVFAMAVLVFAGHQARYRASLPVPPFQAGVAALLNGEPGAMIATEPFPYLWQAQTGTAIFTDATTHSLVSYLPALAPRIEAMYTEVYGISLRDPVPGDYWGLWATRDTSAWHALAARWALTHVAAPAGVPVALPVLYEEGGWRLHDARERASAGRR